MKTPIISMISAAIPFVLSAVMTNPAYAGPSGSSKFVDDVNLTLVGQAIVFNINNTSANKHVDFVNLAVQESKMDIQVSGSAYCNPGHQVRFKGAHAYFGNLSMQGEDAINSADTAYTSPVAVGYKEKKNDIVEYTVDTFSVAFSEVKNAKPSLRVDPLAELAVKLQAHLQGGGKAVDFYRQDQQIVLQRPISVAAVCGNNKNNSAGFETQNLTIKINYKGDNKIYEKAKLNAQLSGNMPSGVTNILPFKLDQATFQPNIPHHMGRCIPTTNPKLRINFQVSGSERGEIDLRVAAVSNTYGAYGNYFETTGMIRDPKTTNSSLDFYFPLKEMLSQPKYAYMTTPNNTYTHNMRIEARFKNMQNGTWGNYQQYGTAVFKHRCTPSLNTELGNTGGVQGGYQQQAPKNGLGLKVQPNITPMSVPKPAKAEGASTPATPTSRAVMPSEPVPAPTTISPAPARTPAPSGSAPARLQRQ